jgi:hypothetical protein
MCSSEKPEIRAELAMDLTGTRTKIAHKDTSNKTPQEIRPKSLPNSTNKKSCENHPKMEKKENARDARD